MRNCLAAVTAVFVLIVVGGLVAAWQVSLSAEPEPGTVEAYLATKAKHILVRRGSRDGVPPAPTAMQASIVAGDKLYGVECAARHVMD